MQPSRLQLAISCQPLEAFFWSSWQLVPHSQSEDCARSQPLPSAADLSPCWSIREPQQMTSPTRSAMSDATQPLVPADPLSVPCGSSPADSTDVRSNRPQSQAGLNWLAFFGFLPHGQRHWLHALVARQCLALRLLHEALTSPVIVWGSILKPSPVGHAQPLHHPGLGCTTFEAQFMSCAWLK